MPTLAELSRHGLTIPRAKGHDVQKTIDALTKTLITKIATRRHTPLQESEHPLKNMHNPGKIYSKTKHARARTHIKKHRTHNRLQKQNASTTKNQQIACATQNAQRKSKYVKQSTILHPPQLTQQNKFLPPSKKNAKQQWNMRNGNIVASNKSEKRHVKNTTRLHIQKTRWKTNNQHCIAQ